MSGVGQESKGLEFPDLGSYPTLRREPRHRPTRSEQTASPSPKDRRPRREPPSYTPWPAYQNTSDLARGLCFSHKCVLQISYTGDSLAVGVPREAETQVRGKTREKAKENHSFWAWPQEEHLSPNTEVKERVALREGLWA